MGGSRLADVDVRLHHETDRAWLVSVDGDRDSAVWVPKSVAEYEPDPRHEEQGTLTLPESLARERGLV